MQGVRREFHITLDRQAISVCCGRSTGHWINSPSGTTERHHHAFYEMQLLLTGELLVTLQDGKRSAIKAGQGVLFAPGAIHQTSAVSGAHERLTLELFFERGTIADQIKEQKKDFWYFSIDEDTMNACRAYMREVGEENPFQKELQELELTRILIHAFRKLQFFREDERKANSSKPRYELEQIDEIGRYLNVNYMEKTGLEKLAQHLHMSTRKLKRVMQKVYGMSYQEKLTSIRMDHAAILLKTTDMSVTDIAAAVGYGSESTFYQTFRRFYSMTPLKYRKLQQSLQSD